MKKLAFSLEINNAEELSKLSDVRLNLADIGKELKTTKQQIDVFNNGTEEQVQLLTSQGKSLQGLENRYTSLTGQQIDLREQQRRLNTELRQQAKDFDRVREGIPDDSLIGLRRRYEQLTREINKLGREARELPENLNKIAEANNIKRQIDQLGESVGDFRSQVGSYRQAFQELLNITGSSGGGIASGIIDPLANILGGPIPGLGQIGEIAEALGPTGLIATATAATATALVGYAADVTLTYERLFDTVGDITQLTGEELRETTAGIKTLSETFDQDFNEVLLASNAIVKSFGEENVSFAESLELIEKGFLASAGANDNFLDQLQEYSVQARETGITQDQLLQVLIRSTQEGIFSDKGIDLIKEGGLAIREETQATRDALQNAFGQTFTDTLLNSVREGSITSFEALQQVSSQLDQLDSQARQQVIADLFKAPGEDASNFLNILGEIDGDVDSLIDTTNAYTQRVLAQKDATQELNEEQSILAAQLQGLGAELGPLTTQLQTFATQILNDVVLGFRAINREAETGGLLGLLQSAVPGLAGQARRAGIGAVLRQEDDERLRQTQVTNENGIQGVDGLREAQSRLTKEIQDARLAGEDYAELQERLTAVNMKLALATGEVNKKVEETKVAANSIEGLREEVSRLETAINQTDPNKIGDLANQLLDAKEKLSQAEETISNFLITPEDSIQKEIENLEILRISRIAAAQATIEDTQALANETARITLESQKDVLNKGLELLDEGTLEYAKQIDEINRTSKQLEDLEVKVRIQASEDALESIERTATDLATKLSESEEELQLRLDIIDSELQVKRLENRLELETLNAQERFDIEQDLLTKKEELLEQEAQLNIDYDNRILEARRETQQELLDIAREALNVTDPEELAELDDRRRQAELEGKREEIELDLELARAKGEDTLALETELAEAELEINKQKNEDIIKAEQERVSEQERINKGLEDIAGRTASQLGTAFAGFISGTIDDFDSLNEALTATIIDGAQSAIELLTPQILGKAVALLGPILGPPAGFAAIGIVRGLLDSAISRGEDGLIVMENGGRVQTTSRQGDVKGGAILQGRLHREGGEHFTVQGSPRLLELEKDEAVINRRSTKKWAGLISAINEDQGGNKLSADSQKFKPILNELRFFQDGGLSDGALIAPQLISPTDNAIVAQTRISDEQIGMIRDGITQSSSAVLEEYIPQIVERVIEGIDTERRISERFQSSQNNSEF